MTKIKDLDFLTKSIIAHRGFHNINNKIPENSIIAFEKAIKYNYTIELDVHILKDKQIVVFHDDNLKRMTGIDKEIKNTTYNEIKELKLQNTNSTIPLLKDVLTLVNGKVPIIIELKMDVKKHLLEKELIKILDNYQGLIAIKSFDPFIINYFRKTRPNIIRGQLSSDFKNKKISKIKKYILKNMYFNIITKPDFISYDIRSIPNKKITKLKEKMPILGWTVKTPSDLEKAKKYCNNFICENLDTELKKDI